MGYLQNGAFGKPDDIENLGSNPGLSDFLIFILNF